MSAGARPLQYKYREDLFPNLIFRRAYDALVHWRGERADVEYVRILHLAATTMESQVSTALEISLATGERFDYADIQALVQPASGSSAATMVKKRTPDLEQFNELVEMSLGGARDK